MALPFSFLMVMSTPILKLCRLVVGVIVEFGRRRNFSRDAEGYFLQAIFLISFLRFDLSSANNLRFQTKTIVDFII